MPIVSCPVCNQNSHECPSQGDYREIQCGFCGTYRISGSAEPMLTKSGNQNNDLVFAALGYWLSEQQRFGRTPMITTDIVNKNKQHPHFPHIQTQVSNLLRFLGNTIGEPGPEQQFSTRDIQFKVGCKSPSGIIGLAKHLKDKGIIESTRSEIAGSRFQASLTVSGWIEYENLLLNNDVGRKAFIAMPFNKPDLDDHWLPALRKAVGQTGYTLERVDDNPEPGIIDTKMKLQIKAARFLLVELTHNNLGAHWEAGLAEGLGKPVIYLRRDESEDRVHFDVEHAFRVQWDPSNFEPALRTLKATIRNCMPDAKMSD